MTQQERNKQGSKTRRVKERGGGRWEDGGEVGEKRTQWTFCFRNPGTQFGSNTYFIDPNGENKQSNIEKTTVHMERFLANQCTVTSPKKKEKKISVFCVCSLIIFIFMSD